MQIYPYGRYEKTLLDIRRRFEKVCFRNMNEFDNAFIGLNLLRLYKRAVRSHQYQNVSDVEYFEHCENALK